MTYTEAEVDAAMCLWEVTLDTFNTNPTLPWNEYRSAWGACDTRDVIRSLAKKCEADWLALTDDERDDVGAFDWEWCPMWLAENWSDQ